MDRSVHPSLRLCRVQTTAFDGMPPRSMAKIRDPKPPSDSAAVPEGDGQPAEPMAVAEQVGSGPLGFARDFPDDPELATLLQAFEAGNYAYVRQHAPALAARTGDPKVAEAARELRRRLDPDPLARNLLLAAIALLAVLAIWSFQHQH